MIAYVKPAYPLRKNLERDDWPVTVKPFVDVPLWISKNTYDVGTAFGTVLLALTNFGIAAFLALFVRFTYIPSDSMFPSVHPGDVTLVIRSIPIGPLKPRVGDVILFDTPEELKSTISKSGALMRGGSMPLKGQKILKRIVAVPGEAVGVKNAQPYVLLDKGSTGKEVKPGSRTSSLSRRYRVDIIGPYMKSDIFPSESWDRQADLQNVLKKDEYFVAGDNGYRSVDSRVWGPLKAKYIFGKASWIVWPLKNFGPIQHGQIFEVNK